MTYIVKIVFAVSVLFFISCNSTNNKEANNNPSQLNLKVANDASYPPFGYIENGNEVVGFEIDLLKEISKIVGFTYDMSIVSFDGIIPALKSGKIDMAISSMSATAERAKAVTFSAPYYEGITIFLKHKDNKTYSVDDLSGKKIGVYIGTVQDIYSTNLAKKDNSITVIRSNDIFGAIMNLKSKKVDIVLADRATAKGYLKDNQELESFGELPDGSEGLAMVFDKNANQELVEKINAALITLKENGKYNELLKKYDLD